MPNYVDRFTTTDRVLHWTVAITFFLLVWSGLGLYAHTFFDYFDFFGSPQQGILAHKWAGVIFFVSSVLLFLRHELGLHIWMALILIVPGSFVGLMGILLLGDKKND